MRDAGEGGEEAFLPIRTSHPHTSARIFVNTQFPVQDGIALSFSGFLPIVNWR
jgi:hypothetical protein